MNKENSNDIKEIAEFISTDMNKIGIENLPAKDELYSIEEIKKFLISKISYLLDHDYDKLVNALYRIDLNELKLHELFSGSNRDSIPEVLADMILERQREKLYWRKKYREGEL